MHYCDERNSIFSQLFFPQITSYDVHPVTAVTAYHLVCCSVSMPHLLLRHSPAKRKVRPASPSNLYLFTSPNSWISIQVGYNNQLCVFQTLRIKDTRICQIQIAKNQAVYLYAMKDCTRTQLLSSAV